MLSRTKLPLAAATIALLAYSTTARDRAAQDCRCFPGDSSWPSAEAWASLNASIGGRLLQPRPIGAVCHDPTFDGEACEALKAVWNDPATHVEHPSSVMMPLTTNASCSPFAPREQPCLIGAYAPYVVNVSSAEDISAGVLFAKKHNVRLVIKNTGSDYLGKSIGAGSLTLWTHHLNTIELAQAPSKAYAGAARVGAGVLGKDLIAFTAENSMTAIAGNGPRVGVVGGYLQGGGHSPLASRHGLAADHALSFKVVTAAGEIVTADAKTNADLFWALRGGGAGTFGVVVEATVGLFEDMPTVMATLSFATENVAGEDEAFWTLVERFVAELSKMTDAGCNVQWMVLGGAFQMGPMTCPYLDKDEADALLKSFTDLLDKDNVVYQKEITPFPKYSDYYAAVAPLQDKGAAGTVAGGMWFIPKDVAGDSNKRRDYLAAHRKLVEMGAIVLGIGMNPLAADHAPNAVLPQWRDVQIAAVVGLPLQNTQTLTSMQDGLKKVTDEFIPLLQAVAPDAGTYLSEASLLDAQWKKNFYGKNYARLADVKQKVDPDGLFYAPTAVGSEHWAEVEVNEWKSSRGRDLVTTFTGDRVNGIAVSGTPSKTAPATTPDRLLANITHNDPTIDSHPSTQNRRRVLDEFVAAVIEAMEHWEAGTEVEVRLITSEVKPAPTTHWMKKWEKDNGFLKQHLVDKLSPKWPEGLNMMGGEREPKLALRLKIVGRVPTIVDELESS